MAVPSKHQDNFRSICKVAFRSMCFSFTHSAERFLQKRNLEPEYVERSGLRPSDLPVATGGRHSRRFLPCAQRPDPEERQYGQATEGIDLERRALKLTAMG